MKNYIIFIICLKWWIKMILKIILMNWFNDLFSYLLSYLICSLECLYFVFKNYVFCLLDVIKN